MRAVGFGRRNEVLESTHQAQAEKLSPDAWTRRRTIGPTLVAIVVLVAAYLPSSSDQLSLALTFSALLLVAWRWRESSVLGVVLLVGASLLIKGVVLRSPAWPLVTERISRFQEQWFEIPFGISLLCSPLLVAVLLRGTTARTPRLVASAAVSVLFSLGVVWGVNLVAARTATDLTTLLVACLPLVLLREGFLLRAFFRSPCPDATSQRAHVTVLLVLAPFFILPAGTIITNSGAFAHPGTPRIAVLSDPVDRDGDLEPIAKCGAENQGVWGELPRFLTLLGYRAALSGDLQQLVTEPPKVLVLLPTGRLLTEADRENLRLMVSRGTSLLVIGEHTNLDHVMESFNPLLADYNLKLRYDTTNSLLGDGMKGLRYGVHPLSHLLKRVPLATYNRGASLEVTGPGVIPILSGVLWHADAGNPLAPERAYLGDQELSSGDRIGDLLLVAAHESLGHKVVVFGDSSPFLNQNLAHNAPLLLGLFAYLAASEPSVPWEVGTGWRLITGLVLAGGVLFVPRLWLTYVAAGTLGIVSVALLAQESALSSEFRSRLLAVPGRLAALSVAEANQFSLDPFSGSSTAGLAMQLSRIGYVPFLGDWYPVADRLAAVFIINPTQMLTTRRLAELKRMSHRGVSVILAGSGESGAFRSLAAALGAVVEPVPLGSRPGDEFTTASAWPVELDGNVQRRFVVDDTQVGGTMIDPHATIVGDEALFYSKNLEWHGKCDERNLDFISTLLQRPPTPGQEPVGEP